MARFLRENGPWSQLIALGNIALHEIEPGREFALTPELQATALVVPHRDEFSDTVGYLVRSPSASLLYLPDIDKWEKWERRIEDVVAQVDAAFLDASFFSLEELPGRAQGEVPHPLIRETMQRLARLAPRVRFVHLNHTNRLLFDEPARREVESRGFRVARDGDVVPLASAQ
jgi:pyrroloquinoline quinone biosynthesis protein B